MNFQIFVSANNCTWSNISTKAKQLFYHTQIEAVIFHKLNLTHIFTIIAENTENFLNSSSYTIECKNSEKISPIVMQNWHFLKCHSNYSSNKCKLLICKSIKAAIDCSYIYCEGRHGKVLQTRVFLFKCTIVFTGVKNKINSIMQNTNQINSTQNTNYNKNIS